LSTTSCTLCSNGTASASPPGAGASTWRLGSSSEGAESGACQWC
jgi:hypothetical protein